MVVAGGRRVLSIIELGGYPNFAPLLQQAGFEVTTVGSMRKALAYLKRETPDIVLAEFNFQSDFRDRTSNLESLFAKLQGAPDTRVVVFYEPEAEVHLERLKARFPVHAAFTFPIEVQALLASLGDAAG